MMVMMVMMMMMIMMMIIIDAVRVAPDIVWAMNFEYSHLSLFPTT